MKIGVAVPTCRPSKLDAFRDAWNDIFKKHGVLLFIVYDGDPPEIGFSVEDYSVYISLKGVNPKLDDTLIISRHTDAVRNAGIYNAVAAGCDIIVTMDDDVYPPDGGDPIEDHINALLKKASISWFNPYTNYLRGFPYGVRTEAQVMVSNGIATGDVDFDSVSKISGRFDVEEFPYVGPLPKGALSPICGMNLAWRREVSQYVYFAPMGNHLGVHRFADIFMGIHLKRAMDNIGCAIYHGASRVIHKCASDKFQNLQLEASGISMNEDYWRGVDSEYSRIHADCRARWERLIMELL